MKKLRIGWAGGAPLPTKANKVDARSEAQFILDRPASYFSHNGQAGEVAWVPMQMFARAHTNAFLIRRTDGSIRTQFRGSSILDSRVVMKCYPSSSDFYNEAETIDFLFLNNGALRRALKMWQNEMLEGEREEKEGPKRSR